MVINNILKQLTPERIKEEVEAVQDVELPVDLQGWVEEFNAVGDRPDFIWRWLYKMNKVWFYSSIQQKYSSLPKIKTLYDMFIVLLDDVAETKGREKLLDELLKVPFREKTIQTVRLDKTDKQYLEFTLKVWHYIKKEIRKFPQHKKIEVFFNYDTAQFLNAVNYAYLVFKYPYFVNTKECWLYLPHSMQILIDFDLDLMCHNKINFEDLGKARKAVLCLQEMGRIGNWLTTWEREMEEGDYTSAVIPYALEHKITSLKELQGKDKKKVIEKIKASGVEDYFLEKKWEERYKKLDKLSKETKLINNKKILEGARLLIFMHFISRGWK